jgi:hypothetical protein
LYADSTLVFDHDPYNPDNNPNPKYTLIPRGNRTITAAPGLPVFQLPPNRSRVILGMGEDMIGLEGLTGTLTITGNSSPALILVDGGTLEMNDGVFLTGNAGGSGVKITEGSNEMLDWVWFDNIDFEDGGYYQAYDEIFTEFGTFVMHGGTISGNNPDVLVEAGGTFNHHGGSPGVVEYED